jgi:hypothetical protein
LKDILDALQGRAGGSKKIRRLAPLIPNDSQIYRVIAGAWLEYLTSFFPLRPYARRNRNYRRGPDPFTLWENRRVKCAEVLVPHQLDAGFISGAYVSCQEAESKLKALAPNLAIIIDPHLFFRA